jgi:hypothetical protein
MTETTIQSRRAIELAHGLATAAVVAGALSASFVFVLHASEAFLDVALEPEEISDSSAQRAVRWQIAHPGSLSHNYCRELDGGNAAPSERVRWIRRVADSGICIRSYVDCPTERTVVAIRGPDLADRLRLRSQVTMPADCTGPSIVVSRRGGRPALGLVSSAFFAALFAAFAGVFLKREIDRRKRTTETTRSPEL